MKEFADDNIEELDTLYNAPSNGASIFKLITHQAIADFEARRQPPEPVIEEKKPATESTSRQSPVTVTAHLVTKFGMHGSQRNIARQGSPLGKMRKSAPPTIG